MKVILSQTLAERQMTQYRLAKITGITPHAINDLCNNKTSRIEFAKIDKICAALNCTPNDILLPETHNIAN